MDNSTNETAYKKWTVALCGGGSSAHILVAMGGSNDNIDVRA